MGKGRIISEALQKGASDESFPLNSLTHFLLTPSLSVVYLPGSYPLNTSPAVNGRGEYRPTYGKRLRIV